MLPNTLTRNIKSSKSNWSQIVLMSATLGLADVEDVNAGLNLNVSTTFISDNAIPSNISFL